MIHPYLRVAQSNDFDGAKITHAFEFRPLNPH
jgi:hypothetical protein